MGIVIHTKLPDMNKILIFLLPLVFSAKFDRLNYQDNNNNVVEFERTDPPTIEYGCDFNKVRQENNCWARCWTPVWDYKSWCWTTKTFSQSYEYVRCDSKADCEANWACAGPCTI